MTGRMTRSYRLKTDWSGSHVSYVLCALDEKRDVVLADMKIAAPHETSFFFLGEVKTIA